MLRSTIRLPALYLFAVALMPIASASAQTDLDALWSRYEAEASAWEALQAECDSGDRATTRIDRVCRESADASAALAGTIAEILAADTTISPEDRALLVDGMLTNQQIAGALWVELGECARGVSALETLLSAPELTERPLVRQAAERKLDEGRTCVAAAQAPAGDSVVSAPPTPTEAPSHAGPITLLAAGGGAVAGALIWDIALGGARSDFSDLRDECGGLCPDAERQGQQEDLQDRIDGAKLPIALMYGGGLALAAGGAVWRIVQGGDAAEVAVAPWLRLDRVGVTFRARF